MEFFLKRRFRRTHAEERETFISPRCRARTADAADVQITVIARVVRRDAYDDTREENLNASKGTHVFCSWSALRKEKKEVERTRNLRVTSAQVVVSASRFAGARGRGSFSLYRYSRVSY